MTAGAGVPLLQAVGLERTFDGVRAVRGVDFAVHAGELRALIGPNGAGKTTLVGLVSGRIAPTAGRVLFAGRDVTRLPAHRRVALGIVTTFQLISLFPEMSVFDNVALAVQRRLMTRPLDRLTLDGERLASEVRGALAEVGLLALAGEPAAALPHGHQRLLDIALSLALRPRLLILDEPTQGLGPEEVGVLTRLIREIAATATILLIEHNIQVVLGLSSRVTVMDQGAIIAEGTPAEIERNPDVQRVYLGSA